MEDNNTRQEDLDNQDLSLHNPSEEGSAALAERCKTYQEEIHTLNARVRDLESLLGMVTKPKLDLAEKVQRESEGLARLESERNKYYNLYRDEKRANLTLMKDNQRLKQENKELKAFRDKGTQNPEVMANLYEAFSQPKDIRRHKSRDLPTG